MQPAISIRTIALGDSLIYAAAVHFPSGPVCRMFDKGKDPYGKAYQWAKARRDAGPKGADPEGARWSDIPDACSAGQ